ncbi:hypothetical protein SAMN05444279_11862 [Ruegeria intermedia]|uniref:Uncharacterized protein n=1 Tax=Ruegeria intermedia TaxID=996115 RepID=A0A1M4Z7H9_9RHOB|nr:hypothetical protein SAMN05444279_11862 [Ruegeria intermedia]
MNSKPHAITDAVKRPLRVFLTAGQRGDYMTAGAIRMLSNPPAAC